MSSSSPERGFDPARLQGRRDLQTFAHMEPPEEGWWWVPLAVVATAVPVSVALFVVADLGGGVAVGGRLLVGLYWAAVVGAWLFSPFALHYDRRYVLARGGWDPSVAYYTVFVPGVGAVAATLYVVERYWRVGLRL